MGHPRPTNEEAMSVKRAREARAGRHDRVRPPRARRLGREAARNRGRLGAPVAVGNGLANLSDLGRPRGVVPAQEGYAELVKGLRSRLARRN